MTDLTGVERIYLPIDIADETQVQLRAIGEHGYEAFALWAGDIEGKEASVRALYIPAQEGLRSDEGVCVVVGGEDLHRLNMWLYEHSLTLIAQVHSHPEDAYHSETDDTYPIIATAGGLSLVVPHFARGPFSLDEWALYRLSLGGEWMKLTDNEARELIALVEG